ncbi:heavy-metal-associated domain-containing protein [Zongyangia hominis]|uniref:Heavy-metal-associated domain-containing protein n=1 Tax=Zongyangia hominis TaxID=2763677 RepID=A0A926IB52_9FIRM|nr:heavy metal-associated domain-containing protein [Zongyangia hominis]MBC8569760.1 heavy-metal-associated domain-containing protein [Zongyangia hominis]
MKERFIVDGMSCSACSRRIEEGLKKLQGVREVEVHLDAKTVVVSGDSLDQRVLKNEIEALGYDVAVMS